MKQAILLLRAKQPSALIFIISLLCIWCVVVVTVFVQLSDTPYIGMVVEGDAENNQFVVRSIAQGQPADRAGIKAGDRFVAIETVDGLKRYNFQGPEAYSGRQRLHSYQMFNDMLNSKSRLWEYTNQLEYVLIRDDGERVRVKAESSRALSSSYLLTLLIAVLLVQSIVTLLISAGIFAFAKPSIGVRVLFVGGMGLVINTMANSFVVTREFVLDPNLYHWIHFPSQVGTIAFTYSLLCLVWYVPKPINRFPFWQCMLVFGLFVFTSRVFQFFEFPVNAYEFPNLILLPFGIIISLVQWQQSRKDPIRRATAQWMFLSIYGSVLIVVVLYNVPLFLMQTPLINPLIASFIIMLMFVGVALGTLKYKLFEVHKYWWKAVTWILGGTLVVLMDILLVAQFKFEQNQALPLALLLAGWVYFPVRQFLFEHFVTSRESKVDNHVGQLIDEFGPAKTAPVFEAKFVEFLKSVFKSDEVTQVNGKPSEGSFITENGLGINVPNLSQTGSLTLYGKSGGTQLFSLNDAATADSFVKLIRNLKDIRFQEQEILTQEKGRIVRDLHDDVGGRLLSLIYKAPDSKMEDEARATLTALKESMIVIEDSEAVDLELAWEQMVSESSGRLLEVDRSLRSTHNLKEKKLTVSTRQYVNLKRIVQELMNNVIKHGEPGECKISLNAKTDWQIEINCENKAKPKGADDLLNGRGIGNIRKRLEEIGGHVRFDWSGNVFVARIEFQLPANQIDNSGRS